MREIKFRGKYKQGKMPVLGQYLLKKGTWVYGDLRIRRVIPCIYDDESRTYPIDIDTIGQFTGLHDKYGKEIYEGDIVEVYDFTSVYASKYRGVVKMYRGSWCVEYEDSILDMVTHPSLFFDDFADRKTEVVGNIHDNPELLKEQR